MPAKLIDLTGKTFGKLQVLRLADYRGKGKTRNWVCRCGCGQLTHKSGSDLRRGYVKSCGCSQVRHGFGGNHRTPEYTAFYAAIDRCENPKLKQFSDYGGRGIKMHPEWRAPGGFIKFFTHVGPRPSPLHSLDRKDVNGDYAPGNVRWATREEQVLNRRKYGVISKFTDEELLAEARRRHYILW